MNRVTKDDIHNSCIRSILQLYLAKEGAAKIVVDLREPRPPELRVPEQFAQNNHLVLDIDYSHPIPPGPIYCWEDSLRVELSFNRQPFLVVVPWSVLVLVLSLRGDPVDEESKPSAPTRPVLRSVDGGKNA
jgi:hypothetical protein